MSLKNPIDYIIKPLNGLVGTVDGYYKNGYHWYALLAMGVIIIYLLFFN